MKDRWGKKEDREMGWWVGWFMLVMMVIMFVLEVK